MINRAEQLALQRRALQLRCALQRRQIAHLTQEIEGQLTSADRVINVVSFVGRSPLALLTIASGVMLLGPWRIVKWVSQGALVFKLARHVQQLIGK